ncbi:MAG TPA: hypothetical protein VNS34_24700 [Rhizobiaceae bacterium]|nr:hypothetical protein [Rhizobiaceae bacterium]
MRRGTGPITCDNGLQVGLGCREDQRAATESGFYDQSALTRHFKRCYGITPLQFARAVGSVPAAR